MIALPAGQTVSILLIFAVAAAIIIWIVAQPYLAQYRRRRISRRPFPAHWQAILQRRVPYLRQLPPDLRAQLQQRMQIFLAEKTFIGCDGLVVTDTMRVTIAAYACLLILNRPTDYYPGLRQILVYPSAFIVNKTFVDGAGVLHPQRQILSGESWSRGQVILSWQDAVEDAEVFDDGYNVVIHEFAHQLDQEKGEATGAPFLRDRAHYPTWSQTWAAAFEQVQQQLRAGQRSVFNDYGASSPAEFSAVASELFFEQPQQLREHYADLYAQLSHFYCVDPAEWRVVSAHPLH